MLRTPNIAWLASALVFAFGTSLVVSMKLIKLQLGRNRYTEFTLYERTKYEMDAYWLLNIFSIAFIVISIVFYLLSIDNYIKITKNEIITNKFFSYGETKYTYKDIDSIVLIKSYKNNSSEQERIPYHEVHFTDGYTWSSFDSLHDGNWEQENNILQFISYKSEKSITERIDNI